MIGKDQVQLLMGCTALDSNGDTVGAVGQVYLDDRTGEAAWVTVNTGLFGTTESFIPLAAADLDGDVLRVSYPKETVKGAPKVATDGHLEMSEERELYRYYDLAASDEDTDGGGIPMPAGDVAMHEHQGSDRRLTAGDQSREGGRTRLRKFVTPE